jgi:hypothetical protein
MKKYYIFILLIVFTIACDEESGVKETKGNFKVKGSWQEPWDIHCNDQCTRCQAIYTPGINDPTRATVIDCDPTITLDGFIQTLAYEKCKNGGLPDGGYIFDDSLNTSLSYIRFLKTTGTKYGFDDWKDNGKSYRDKITYTSIAVGDSTTFNIDVRYGLTYHKYVAVINNSSNLFFDKALTMKAKEIMDGENVTTIYSSTSGGVGTANVQVIGISKGGDSSCLAGDFFDCEDAEDDLEVHIYNEKTISGHKLYMVNNPAWKPTASEWKQQFNTVLKQAVAKLDTTNVVNLSQLDWDVNSNGIADLPVGFALTQDQKMGGIAIVNELGSILDLFPFEYCRSNLSSANFILKGGIRMHYILTADAHIGDTILTFHTTAGLSEDRFTTPGTLLHFGPFYTPNDTVLLLVTKVIDKNKIQILNMTSGAPKGLTKDYLFSNGITAYTDKLGAGITPTLNKADKDCASCSFVSDSYTFQTNIHEFLHQAYAGHLKHVGTAPGEEKDNIMYFESNRTDTKLRFRSLDTPDGNDPLQKQWDDIQH